MFSFHKSTFQLLLFGLIVSPLFAKTVSAAGKGAVEVVRGTLVLTMTPNDDLVSVTIDRGNRQTLMDDQVVIYLKSGSTRVTQRVDMYSGSFKQPQRLISRISFDGGRGDDTFKNLTDLPSFARGGDGNDVLIGGSSSDTFYGEAGKDSLHGNDGDDQLYGGDDSDWINGGYGQDVMLGRDNVVENGNDRLAEPQRNSSGFYDRFTDEFDLSHPVLDGTRPMDVDQQRSESCTILSSLASAAQQGVNLENRIFQNPDDPTLFTVMLYQPSAGSAVGDVPLFVDVHFDGTWNSNDCPPTRMRSENGRPTGKTLNEFWALLYQRAYLTAYITNWESADTAEWFRPTSSGPLYGWGQRGHALRAIVGGSNPGSWNWDGAEDGAAPSPEEVWMEMNAGTVMTTRVSGHIVALMDVFNTGGGEWYITIYNQRALDNYASRGALDDGSNDGMMTFRWEDYLNAFNVLTPYIPEID